MQYSAGFFGPQPVVFRTCSLHCTQGSFMVVLTLYWMLGIESGLTAKPSDRKTSTLAAVLSLRPLTAQFIYFQRNSRKAESMELGRKQHTANKWETWTQPPLPQSALTGSFLILPAESWRISDERKLVKGLKQIWWAGLRTVSYLVIRTYSWQA